MDAAFRVVEAAIARGPIPGAAVAVDDRLACFGRLETDGPAVTSETWYDLVLSSTVVPS